MSNNVLKDKVNANLQKFLENSGEVTAGETEANSDVVATKVMAALEQLGISKEDLHAKLVVGEEGEMEFEEGSEEEMEEAGDDIEAQVTDGVIKVLAALGIDVEDDEEGEGGEMEAEGDEDEALDEIGDMVTSYLQKHPSSEAAAKLTTRLTASMNISVMAIAQRQSSDS